MRSRLGHIARAAIRNLVLGVSPMSAAQASRPLLAAALLCTALASSAATVALSPTVDGFVEFNGSLPNSPDLDASFTATRRDGVNNVRNAIYEFDLASIPDGSTIDAVRLYLTLSSPIVNSAGGNASITFVGYAGDGAVTAADHQNTTAGTTLTTQNFAVGTVAGTLLEIDLGAAGSSLIESLLLGDLLTMRTQTVDGVTFNVASLEHATLASALLVVDYTPIPVPAALGLFAPAIFGLWAGRRSTA
jgi:hypothetical protein